MKPPAKKKLKKPKRVSITGFANTGKPVVQKAAVTPATVTRPVVSPMGRGR